MGHVWDMMLYDQVNVLLTRIKGIDGNLPLSAVNAMETLYLH